MQASVAITITLELLQHVADLQALIAAATAQGRDLNADEVAALKAKAMASIDKLAAEA
jgi:hypothetical protein